MRNSTKTLALWLADATNEFQQMMKTDVEAVCRKAGLDLVTHFTGYDIHPQVREIRAALAQPDRPDAFLVLATRDRGLGSCARQAVRDGASWFFLNAVEDDLDEI